MISSQPPASGALRRRLSEAPDVVVRAAEPMAPKTTFRIGGPAEFYVETSSVGGLAEVVGAAREAAVPLQVVGLGSNLLVPDEGLAGIVLRLTGDFERFDVEGDRVTVGGALPLGQVARHTAKAGLAGLEALCGFPSTTGGAVYMNAGCYGTEIRDVLESALILWPDGRRERLSADDLQPEYRRTRLHGTGAIVAEAVFRLQPGSADALLARIAELNEKRRESLPTDRPNAGSIFRNPEGDYAGRLVQECGLRGRSLGGAQISPRHGNVIVNLGNAKALDVLGLMVDAHRAVADRFGVALEPEIVLAGRLADEWRRAVGARP